MLNVRSHLANKRAKVRTELRSNVNSVLSDDRLKKDKPLFFKLTFT